MAKPRTQALEQVAAEEPEVFERPTGEFQLMGQCQAYGCVGIRSPLGRYCVDHLFGDVEIDGLPQN